MAIYSKQTKIVIADDHEFEVNHYTDGDIMIKQGGSKDMIFIPTMSYDLFMAAMARPEKHDV